MTTYSYSAIDTQGRETRGTIQVADQTEALKRIKGGSSSWIKENFPGLKSFGWQDGYGAFSVNPSETGKVISYIGNRHEHHSYKSYQDEFRAFLKKYDVEYDERYVWD